jgi:ABC-type Fe3+-hydroxamate transport system substrate-binding protein
MKIKLAIFFFLLTSIAVPCFASRTVKDGLGRTVEVPDHPQRVVCLMPSLVDDVYALGAGSDIVGVVDDSKYPPEAKTKPTVGLPLDPKIESILSLHPDLVLAGGEPDVNKKLDELQKAKIPVFAVAARGIEGIYQSIASVGLALNREQQAAALVGKLRDRVAAVQRQVAGKPVVNVLMPIWSDPVITIGKDAYITDLIALAGGHSVTSDLPGEWPQISLDDVLKRAPDALVLVGEGRMSVKDLATRPGWINLSAVKNKRIYWTDDRIEHTSPVAFDALEDLAKQLHP